MTKRNCPPGSKWDNVVTTCIQNQDLKETRPEPETEPTPVFHQRTTSPTAWSDPISLSPVLWIAVVLTTLGSIVALALWFILYRRQRRLNTTSEMEPGPEPPQKIEPPNKSHLSDPQRASSASFYQQGPHDISKSQKATGRGETDSTEELGELPVCNAMREHRLPLPATELGGTALVTTKTV
ncbi:tumor necrosis factor receptor superfamily member 13C-like isoform X2 [Corythoichthys intestinalis]|uniref:tumor necrosis factor receptor superfamily member 13C-like isoform X2 n=1 Tax=Corythoichthys intestinalis TaxID=161448 RepID=UPI0025A5C933|nr:tumor necrosis factor receptor superfamily member 13C-like isoform X2 [Corythoichthys intestinalis]